MKVLNEPSSYEIDRAGFKARLAKRRYWCLKKANRLLARAKRRK